MTLLLFYLALALGFSFLCSILEAVLLSITPSFVMAEERRGSRLGATLAKLKDNIDRPLAAILSLNTIAHTVGAAGVGAQALEVIGDWAVAVVSAVLTLLILVFSEIIPKTLGAVYWKRLVPVTARLLPPLITVMYPFVLMAQGLTLMLSQSETEPTMSRSEIEALTEVAAQEGVLDSTEHAFLSGLLGFAKLRAGDIMTPRTVMLVAPVTTTAEEFVADESNLRFSRIPVVGDSADDIKGYVLKHDILLALAQGKRETLLGDLVRPIQMAPAKAAVAKVLGQLLAAGEHIAQLVDEYGGTAGIITLEDVLEDLLGLQIVDETDAVSDMQELAKERWQGQARRLAKTGQLPVGRPSGDDDSTTGTDSE